MRRELQTHHGHIQCSHKQMDGSLTLLTCQSSIPAHNKKETDNNTTTTNNNNNNSINNDSDNHKDNFAWSTLELTRLCDIVLISVGRNGPSDAEEQKE